MLVWQTGYDVVGAPYGNAEALTDTRQVLMARSDGAARAVIERRGIDLIVVCRFSGKNRLYGAGDESRLIARLIREQPPAWLERVELPPDLSATFRLVRFTQARPVNRERQQAPGGA